MRIAGAYIRLILKKPAFYLCILGCALISFWGISGAGFFNHNSSFAAYITFTGIASEFGFMLDYSTYRKLILAIACVPFAPVFCTELKSGYTKSVILRSSVKSYIIVHTVLNFIVTFLVAFLGMTLCVGVLAIFFPLANEAIVYDYTDAFSCLLNTPDTALEFILCKAYMFSLSLGAWSVSGAVISAIYPDPFIAVCTPLVMSYVLEFISMEVKFLPNLYSLSVGYVYIDALDKTIPALLYITFIFLLLGAIFAAVFYVLAKGRLRQ